ncbi:hypothetical protein [Egicoccus sp. AB-alg2]|uniref:hypothetical protein n=1 Tax=Egicoccus sp. AB-alg2 TaxID=3242693 RepID=UPI00359DD663
MGLSALLVAPAAADAPREATASVVASSAADHGDTTPGGEVVDEGLVDDRLVGDLTGEAGAGDPMAHDAAPTDAPPGAVTDLPAPGVPEGPAPSADEPADEPADEAADEPGGGPSGRSSAGSCHALTRLTPDAVEGDPFAVSITAQTRDAGVPGWVAVQWEVDPAVQAARVLLTHRDGNVAEATDPYRGFATDVLELTLCGARPASPNDDHAGGETDLPAADPTASPDAPAVGAEGNSRDGAPTLPATGPAERPRWLAGTGLLTLAGGLGLLRAASPARRARRGLRRRAGGSAA